jgi:ABC-type transport system involved in cytochrome c biogenesis ATPase subunit
MTDTLTSLKLIIPICLAIISITILEGINLMQGNNGAVLTTIIAAIAGLGGLEAGRLISKK